MKKSGQNIAPPMIYAFVVGLIFGFNKFQINKFRLKQPTSVFHYQFLITPIFSVSLKFEACYITGQWGELRVKNAT